MTKPAHPRRDMEALLGAPPKKRAGRKPGDGGKPPTPTRDRLNAAQAALAEIRAAKIAGELVERSAVAAAMAALALDIRAGMLALPSRLGARLGLTPAQIAEADAEVRAVLEALADAGSAAA